MFLPIMSSHGIMQSDVFMGLPPSYGRRSVFIYAQWAEDILKRHPDFNKDNAKSIIEDEIGKAFLEVLEDAGVFKRNENGQKAFKEFITSINE